MKNKRQIVLVPLFFFVITCILIVIFVFIFYEKNDAKRSYNQLVRQYRMQYLDYENLEYFYSKSNGWMEEDFKYFVFEFEERPEEFILQFKNPPTIDNLSAFVYSENEDFSNALVDKLKKYLEISPEYQIEFNESYIFSRYPTMVYFENTKRLYIVLNA